MTELNDNTPAICAEGLTKNFVSAGESSPTNRALDNVSLSIPRGCICGLLGPNGAGKTTLLRIINNILVADAGTVSILGLPVSMETTSPLIGYMPEERGLYDRMRIEEQIMYFGMLKGGDRRRLREVMDEYLELFNLSGDKRRRIKELSKGNQQKVQIIATLVHEPQVVMLDEPFSGFDPINGELLRQLIERLNRQGTTIVLSSHNMEAVERMCNRIAMIDHGHIMLDGDLTEIKERYRDGSLIISTRGELHLPLLQDSGIIGSIDTWSDAHAQRGFTYRVTLKPGIPNAELLKAVSMQGDIIRFEEHLPSLNEIFLGITAR